MSVLTTDHCLLVHEDFNRILAATLRFARERGYAPYHKKRHTGLLRNLVVRRGQRTRELLVNLVTSSQGEIDGEAFAERLLSLDLEGRFAGILHTTNDGVADFIRREECRALRGGSFYMEELMGLRFKVGAFSFFQANVEAVERLYKTAISWLPGLAGKRVFDLYCGAGTITQALARSAGQVTGVELVAEAAEAARENARMNGLENCRFINEDVLTALDGLAEAPDVVVLDPPRAGIHPKALPKIMKFKAGIILYISCNPKSLSADLSALRESYAVRRIAAFDNFPFTDHTEAAALLELRK
jgi:23S rRNA (uracil-5-)-methyltransferase RumA